MRHVMASKVPDINVDDDLDDLLDDALEDFGKTKSKKKSDGESLSRDWSRDFLRASSSSDAALQTPPNSYADASQFERVMEEQRKKMEREEEDGGIEANMRLSAM